MMTDDEKKAWAGACVLITSLTVAVTALRRGQPLACDEALGVLSSTFKDEWEPTLQRMLASDRAPAVRRAAR